MAFEYDPDESAESERKHCAPGLSQSPRRVAASTSAAYQAALDRPDFPEIARRFLAYAVSCSPVSPLDAAIAFLHTAWVCDDHQREREAAVARQLSASWFLECKPFPATQEGLGHGTVLVDVLRRCGRFEEAARECETLLFVPELPLAIRERLLFEQRLIHREDWRCHRVAKEQTPICSLGDGVGGVANGRSKPTAPQHGRASAIGQRPTANGQRPTAVRRHTSANTTPC